MYFSEFVGEDYINITFFYRDNYLEESIFFYSIVFL